MKGGGQGNGLERGQTPSRSGLGAFTLEECNQAVMDFLAATEVGKFLRK